jgi:antitoxin VapB
METRTAKLFMNGASQAVRLPAEFRFTSEEVFISRDASTGDVVLSTRPGGRVWADYFKQLRGLSIPDTFMETRELNKISSATGIFDDELEMPTIIERATTKKALVLSPKPKRTLTPTAKGKRVLTHSTTARKVR